MEATPGQSLDPLPGFPSGLNSVKVTVQVYEFECPEEEMNEHLQEAMEASEYPGDHFQAAAVQHGGRNGQGVWDDHDSRGDQVDQVRD